MWRRILNELKSFFKIMINDICTLYEVMRRSLLSYMAILLIFVLHWLFLEIMLFIDVVVIFSASGMFAAMFFILLCVLVREEICAGEYSVFEDIDVPRRSTIETEKVNWKKEGF